MAALGRPSAYPRRRETGTFLCQDFDNLAGAHCSSSGSVGCCDHRQAGETLYLDEDFLTFSISPVP